MGTWLINGKSMESLGVADLQLSYRNQATDEARILLARDYDASISADFPYGGTLPITLDGRVVFRGRVTRIQQVGEARREALQVTLSGPWWYLENRVAGGSMPYFIGNAAVYTGTTFAPRFPLGASATTYVQYCATQNSSSMQLGTVSLPGVLTTAGTEVENITYAELMRTALRLVPGAFVWFDYTVNPPRMNCTYPGGSGVNTFTVTEGAKLEALRVTPRPDLQLGGVALYYLRDVRLTDKTSYYEPAKQYTLPRVVSTDIYPTNATAFAVNVLTQSVKLSGTDQFWNQSLAWDTLTLGTYLINGNPASWASNVRAAWLKFWTRYGKGTSAASVTSVTSSTLQLLGFVSQTEDTNAVRSSLAEFRDYAYIEGSNNIPMELMRELMYSPSKTTGDHVARFRITQTWNGSTQVSTDFVAGYNTNHGQTSGGGYNVKYEQLDASGEAAPSGVAQRLYDASQQVAAEGDVAIADQEFDPAMLGCARIIVQPGARTYAGVQSVDVSVMTGRTALRFGPPTQLGPQDLITQLRARKAGA